MYMASNICPCCGLYQLAFSPGGDDICAICKWQDDPVQRKNPDFEGGANDMSLYHAKSLFAQGKDKHGNPILIPLVSAAPKATAHVLATCAIVLTEGKVAVQV